MKSKWLLLLLMVLLMPLPSCAAEDTDEAKVNLLQSKVRAPEFPAGLDWLNTSEPISIADLRGKIVILDFWTYCCINCHHVMVDLKKLEAKYPDALVVIGVHSAKFTTEQDSENIRQAVLRHELEHPVVNDSELQIWREYGVRAWPTLMLIDPEGYVVGKQSGEGVFDIFDQAVSSLIVDHEEKGTLDREKTIDAIQPMLHTAPNTLLSFPQKVLADSRTNLLFIADTNNNRIVVANLDTGEVGPFIGSGKAGRQDGSFAEAQFDKPTGLFLEGDSLYIADTENHLIRRANLETQRVQTIAGTGRQADMSAQWQEAMSDPTLELTDVQSGDSLQTALNSPWDVYIRKDILYIANAGSHQLFRMNLETGLLEPHAGSGRENRVDGKLLAAQLAQPSGLSADEDNLYFADSEVSAIRSAAFDENGNVVTVAGGELFDYGQKDSSGLDARFQHPLGVVYRNGKVYVADTYNNAIRKVDVATQKVSTVFGSGEQGMKDGSFRNASFDEPAGISLAGDVLYIADTNNHLIRTANLTTGEVNTIKLKLPVSLSKERVDDLLQEEPSSQNLAAASFGQEVALNLVLPEGTKLNLLADSLLVIRAEGQDDQTIVLRETTTMVNIPAAGEVKLGLILYYCDKANEGLCYFDSRAISLKPVENAEKKIVLKVN